MLFYHWIDNKCNKVHFATVQSTPARSVTWNNSQNNWQLAANIDTNAIIIIIN